MENQIRRYIIGVLRHWKFVVVFLCIGIILGCYFGFSKIGFSDTAASEDEITKIQQEINKLQSRYILKIDSGRVLCHRYQILIQCDTMPTRTQYGYEDDPLANIKLSYQFKLRSAEIMNIIKENHENVLSSDDIRLMTDAWTNDGDVVTFHFVDVSEQKAKAIGDIVIPEIHRIINADYIEHTYDVIAEYTTYDKMENVLNEQKYLRTQISDLQAKLNTMQAGTFGGIFGLIRSVVIYMTIMLVLALLILLFVDFADAQIQTESEFAQKFPDVNIYGIIPQEKKSGKIASLVYNLQRNTKPYNSALEGFRCVASLLDIALSTKGLGHEVFVTGTIDEEELAQSKNLLELSADEMGYSLKFFNGKNVAYNSSSIQSAYRIKNILLIEQLNESQPSEIEKELAVLNEMGIHVHGVLLISG
ncbi:hypothetical protein LJC20_03210 [Eubacteriales bacterium OttesenSCG-928-M02]|nr:hypothetical protein [Eubacteriales bacterium OttesenSCG-928-M02]